MVQPTIFGVTGAAIILGAYLLELFEHVSPENQWFLLANILGSVLLFIYAFLLDNIVFMVTNAVWAVGSAYELWKVKNYSN